MIYCDTSVLIAAFTNEPRTPEVRAWLRAHEERIVLSGWVETELASAVALKQRTRALDRAAGDAVIASFRILARGVVFDDIERRHFEQAAALVFERVDGVARSRCASSRHRHQRRS